MICDPPTRARLEALGRLVVSDAEPMPDAQVDAHLPEAVAILGQTDLPAERLARAERLRAVVNVEGNLLPNVDYAAARDRGIHVLVASPAFAPAVAEAALGMAIDLARGIGAADRAMRAGTESYGLDSNAGAFLLTGAPVGIVGFGDLGRALRRLLAPFGCPVRVHDPWLPELVDPRRGRASPPALDELLAASRVVFVFAAATSENEGFLGERELRLIPPGGVLLLMSRAGVVDFDALVARGRRGADARRRRRVPRGAAGAGPSGARARRVLLSPHRAGGMPEAFLEIGRLAVADLELILRGLPPVALQARRGRDGGPDALAPGRALLTYASRDDRGPSARRAPRRSRPCGRPRALPLDGHRSRPARRADRRDRRDLDRHDAVQPQPARAVRRRGSGRRRGRRRGAAVQHDRGLRQPVPGHARHARVARLARGDRGLDRADGDRARLRRAASASSAATRRRRRR